jgi:sulfite reductase beta subunit-like hemoprotein
MSSAPSARPGRPLRKVPEPSWELIWKRNYVERLKREKMPLDVLAELPQLIETGYEDVPEEDFVRLQWFGLYHDKPKVGRFMMRIKLPGGVLTAAQLRTLGEVSTRFGQGYGELTTRQNIQLHDIELAALPEIFQILEGSGMTTVTGCGDTVRNITGCPVAGLHPQEAFDTRPLLEEMATFFYGNREYSDLPRKHKITLSACPHQCSGPEFHCIALLAAPRGGEKGYAFRIGGGLATWPRLSDDLGVWVPETQALEVTRAIIDVWKEDLQSRMSRAKSRLKFLADRLGPEAYRALVEARLGRSLEEGVVPTPPTAEHEHTGVQRQAQEGFTMVGFPVFLGLVNGEQMAQLAEVVERYGGPEAEIRLTRRQNFILTHIPDAQVDAVVAQVAALGFPLEGGGLRASSIACTGEPFCNFAVAETKHKLAEIVRHLEAVFGQRVAGLRLNLDGCPNSCAHHWIGDIGLQGTTLRQRGPAGERLRGYDIFLRGGLGANAAIGRPVLRRVPGWEIHRVVEQLLHGYFAQRQEGESIQAFCIRHSDEELIALGSLPEAN